jgi:hypothetical protein
MGSFGRIGKRQARELGLVRLAESARGGTTKARRHQDWGFWAAFSAVSAAFAWCFRALCGGFAAVEMGIRRHENGFVWQKRLVRWGLAARTGSFRKKAWRDWEPAAEMGSFRSFAGWRSRLGAPGSVGKVRRVEQMFWIVAEIGVGVKGVEREKHERLRTGVYLGECQLAPAGRASRRDWGQARPVQYPPSSSTLDQLAFLL